VVNGTAEPEGGRIVHVPLGRHSHDHTIPSGDLAEAERALRQAVPDSCGDTRVSDWALVALLAEYDAMRAELARLRAATTELTIAAGLASIHLPAVRAGELGRAIGQATAALEQP
jgi:hypothetical protein